MTEERRQTLIKAAKEGKVKAFEELIALDKLKLQSFALSITGGNYSEAQDILQEALLKAYRNIKKFREHSSFSSWLWRIIKNEFLQYKRNISTRTYKSLGEDVDRLEESTDTPEEGVINDERNALLWQVIEQLPLKEKEVVTLLYMQEMSYKEAAEILDTTDKAIRSIAWRAKRKMIELVKKSETF